MNKLFTLGTVLTSLLLCAQASAAILPALNLDFKTKETVVDQNATLKSSCTYLVHYTENDESLIQKTSQIQATLTHNENGFHLSSIMPLSIGGPFIKPMFHSEFMGCTVTLKVKLDLDGTEANGNISFYLSNNEAGNLASLELIASRELEISI